jgi:hypothetical protein
MENDNNWSRPNWQPGGGNPLIFLVVYGLTEFPEAAEDTGRTYRTRGVPDGVDVHSFKRADHGDYLTESFEQGYAWEELVHEDAELSRAVLASPGVLGFIGEPAESADLMYLRDLIGLTAWLADHGAVAIYDPWTFRWWRPAQWKEAYFAEDKPEPWRHVLILYSAESDGLWLHTRGLIVFGRPDLSMRGVAEADYKAAMGMCNELIAIQASGDILPEGQVLRHPILGAFTVHHEGDRDDPEFNNSHIELVRRGG